MRLHSYVNEILDMALFFQASPGVGMGLFLTNVQKGKQYYGGAPEVNFGALHPYYRELLDSQKSFLEALDRNNAEIVRMRGNGERFLLRRFMESEF